MAEQAEIGVVGGTGGGGRGRILIADDERIVVRNLEQVFKKDGYEVAGTQSGAAALALLEKQPWTRSA